MKQESRFDQRQIERLAVVRDHAAGGGAKTCEFLQQHPLADKTREHELAHVEGCTLAR